MKRVILIMAVVLMIAQVVFSQDTDKLFVAANNSYQKGDYISAIDSYKKIIAAGNESAELWFNLGNAYYKLNKTADAIVSFERAKQISPNDEDIEFNLKIANLRTIDRFQQMPKLFLFEWYESLKNMYSSDTWSFLAITFLWIAAITAAAFLLIWALSLRKILFGLSLASLVISVICLFSAFQKFTIEQTKDTAIIYKPSVYVKSSPDEKSTDLFILHEGTKVKLLDEVGQWKKIRLANGNLGWLKDKEIEVI